MLREDVVCAVSLAIFKSVLDFFLFFWLRRVACRILVPPPGIKPAPTPPAVEVQSLNHWTAREVPVLDLKKKNYYDILPNIVLDNFAVFLP